MSWVDGGNYLIGRNPKKRIYKKQFFFFISTKHFIYASSEKL